MINDFLFYLGPDKGKDIKPLLIRPICNLFCFWSPKYKTFCWCGVDHNSKELQVRLLYYSFDIFFDISEQWMGMSLIDSIPFLDTLSCFIFSSPFHEEIFTKDWTSKQSYDS